MGPDSPFQYRPYRYLFSAQLTSLFGTGVTTIAIALLAVDIAGESAAQVLGIALSLKMIVYVFGAPVLSTIASRFTRRTWLIALDLVRAGTVLALPLASQAWHLYLLIVLINLAAASFTPVFQATIPAVVDNDRAYQRALAYAQMAYAAEQLLSPLVAAALLLYVTFDVLFLLNSITFIVSALLIALATLGGMRGAKREIDVGSILFGLRVYLRTPRLRAAFMMYFAVASASAMIVVNSVVYVVYVLGLSDSYLGLTLAASGLGTLAGAAATPRLLRSVSYRSLMLASIALLAGGLASATWTPAWPGMLTTWFCLGLGLGLAQTPVGTLVRLSSHNEHRDAVFAANFSLSHLCWLLAYLGAGLLGTAAGLPWTFALATAIAIMSFLGVWLTFPNPDPLEIRHQHQPLSHSHHGSHDEAHTPEAPGEPHRHGPIEHSHHYVIDEHHPTWAA